MDSFHALLFSLFRFPERNLLLLRFLFRPGGLHLVTSASLSSALEHTFSVHVLSSGYLVEDCKLPKPFVHVRVLQALSYWLFPTGSTAYIAYGRRSPERPYRQDQLPTIPRVRILDGALRPGPFNARVDDTIFRPAKPWDAVLREKTSKTYPPWRGTVMQAQVENLSLVPIPHPGTVSHRTTLDLGPNSHLPDLACVSSTIPAPASVRDAGLASGC